MHPPRQIGFLLYEGFLATDVVGPADIFHCAGRETTLPEGATPYSVRMLAARPGPVRSNAGIEITATAALDEALADLDTLFIPGADRPARARLLADEELAATLCRAAGRVRRLASVCTGAFVLADLGLLDGRHATTHWMFARALAASRTITVEPDSLFVQDGTIYTSAGVTAGMDLALAMIEADHGRKAALELARLFVLHLKRPGGQSQFSVDLQAQLAAPDPFGRLLDWLRSNLAADLSVESLAAQAGMSPRNFARRFAVSFAETPARFVERLRVDRARTLIEDTTLPLATVAGKAGFGDERTMRRAFRRVLGAAPHDIATTIRRERPHHDPSGDSHDRH